MSQKYMYVQVHFEARLPAAVSGNEPALISELERAAEMEPSPLLVWGLEPFREKTDFRL